MKQIERIRKLLHKLPKKDQPLGEQFIQTRDFESLKDLVGSAIYNIRRYNNKINNGETIKINPEYDNIDLAELSILKSEVDLYLVQLDWENDENYNESIEDIYYD